MPAARRGQLGTLKPGAAGGSYFEDFADPFIIWGIGGTFGSRGDLAVPYCAG